jgi:molybdopterin synthase sulfur carrier subunit
MAVLRLFAGAREAAGTGRDDVAGSTVGEVIDAACARYGESFAQVVDHCQIWRNGEPCERTDPVRDTDEVAVLPPVSGGAG